MESGAHIPTYLLCERFAAGGRILDLGPPDLEGARLLAPAARLVVVAESGKRQDAGSELPPNLVRAVAAEGALPFGRGAFDMVVVPLLGAGTTVERVDERVRAVRGLLHPSGLLAVLVHNRDGSALDGTALRETLDFLDFERVLRRHFPHVVLLAQQPLHGAVLSPIGRRTNREAPLFDDRLLPDGGEAPVCFLALCSPRYRKVDDVVIARLPFAGFAAGIRERVERLTGTIDLLRREQEAQRAAAAGLEQRAAGLRAELDRALLETRERAAIEARAGELEEALRRRDQALAEGDRAREALQRRIDELEQGLQAAGQEHRRLERRAAAAEQAVELAAGEREERERELDRARQELRETRAEAKAKQRELDDVMEQLAGTEAELAGLVKEAARQRRELITARERGRGLEQELLEKETDRTRIDELTREVEQVRAAAAAERDRFERRLDEERERAVEVSTQRDAALQGAREARHRLAGVERELELGRERIAELEQRRLDTATAAEGRLAELSGKLAEAERAATELAERLALAEREAARAAEARAEAEGRAETARRLQQEAEVRAVEDREELERLRPRATAVEAVRQLARAAEARAETLHGELEQARADLSEARARLERSELDLARTMEALAESAEDSTVQRRDVAEGIRAMQAENRRLRQETEGELLRVREDLETELRAVGRQLEAREQEIWELREEVIRLRAQGAASVAASENHGEAAGIHRTLFEQENIIAGLREECERLRFECEKRQRSLDVRKKNLRILASLLRQEREARRGLDSEPPRPGAPPGGEPADSDIDIARMIEEAVDDFEDVDDALDTVRVPQELDEPGDPRDDS